MSIVNRATLAMKHPTFMPTIPPSMAQRQDIFMCPACHGPLIFSDDRSPIGCSHCQRGFRSEDGIPLLFWPHESPSQNTDVTDTVKAFYEETPFPNYDDLDSPDTLRAKAEQGIFARLLNDQISHGWHILECGCGTGQLSNFLALTWGRTIFATDVCLNSLKLGNTFRAQHNISNVAFLQMNLFKPAFRPETFDLAICNGVLHHTSDPFLGFQSILKCVKPGGFIIIGLYNVYARLTTDIRRLIFRLTGARAAVLDRRVKTKHLSAARKRAWFRDQYQHPHESKHSFGEVLRWFDQTGVQFVNSVPKAAAALTFSPDEQLFEVNAQGMPFDRFLVQAGMLLSGGRDGGLFIMIGRKATSHVAAESE